MAELVQQHALEIDLVQRGVVGARVPALAVVERQVALDHPATLDEVGLHAEHTGIERGREAGDIEAVLLARPGTRPAQRLQAPTGGGGLGDRLEAGAGDRPRKAGGGEVEALDPLAAELREELAAAL